MVDQQVSLIDEINKQISEFKINKDKKDEETSGEFIFVNKEESRFWLSLFLKNFLSLSASKKDHDEDDLLFFIRKKPTKLFQQYETKLEVFRKDSKKMPIGELNVDFEETFYLNTIMQKFSYTLVYAICCRTAANQMEIIKKHVQRIYPSPSHRTMDSKGNYEKITYPEIYFSIDNYEELLEKFPVYNQECVCIEVIAKEINGKTPKSIYFGLIDYDSIKDLVDAKTLPKKTLLIKNRNNSLVTFNTKFLTLKGPNEKGCGEIAVQMNHRYDTPDTEKFNLEDFEWDRAIESKPLSRRMSDPFLIGYISSWKERRVQKSKSESENVNELGLEFIEAKDINEELRNETVRRMWEQPGFSQTYFANKESRKASYPSYNTYLTFVSFPWYTLIADALAPAKPPILIF